MDDETRSGEKALNWLSQWGLVYAICLPAGFAILAIGGIREPLLASAFIAGLPGLRIASGASRVSRLWLIVAIPGVTAFLGIMVMALVGR
ncbi:hypothetical protein [Lysobacter hankyongensis]